MASPKMAMRPAAALVKVVGIDARFAIDDTADCFTDRGPMKGIGSSMKGIGESVKGIGVSMKGIGERSVEVDATCVSASCVAAVTVTVTVTVEVEVEVVVEAVIVDDAVITTTIGNGVIGGDEVDVTIGKGGVDDASGAVVVVTSIGNSVSKGTSG
jgi:hypothetical protein